MRMMVAALALLAGALMGAPVAAAGDARIVFPAEVQQGAMVIGRVPPGSRVEYDGRGLRVTG